MGSVYKRKRRSCALCKPHKVGWAPRLNNRERSLRKLHEAEIRSARRTRA